MHWRDVPEVLDDWTLRVAAPAWDLKRAAANAWTVGTVGYYLNPVTDQVALYGADGTRTDRALCKAAAQAAVGTVGVRPEFLTLQELAAPEAQWVKVAYSPNLIRRIGTALNFFPGQYPGGIPNFANPLTAMLTAGVVGTGLGYGVGRLGEAILPEGWGENLGQSGAIAGGLAGAGLGGVWAGTNLANKKSLLSGWPLNQPADALPAPDPESPWAYGYNPEHPALKKAGELLEAIPLPAWFSAAAAKAAAGYGETFAQAYQPRASSPTDVNVNAMGQLLWDTGASPQLAATTMGTLYAAHQLPDPYAQPGMVTGNQLGQLAMNAAGDYVTGLLVGKALNMVVGTPYRASTYGLGNAALGIIGTVVPRLLGQ